jgi:hypothetical protein
MISLAITPEVAGKTNTDVIGPYSAWPRRNAHHLARPTLHAGGARFLGEFTRRVVPFIARRDQHSTEGART